MYLYIYLLVYFKIKNKTIKNFFLLFLKKVIIKVLLVYNCFSNFKFVCEGCLCWLVMHCDFENLRFVIRKLIENFTKNSKNVFIEAGNF